MKKRNAFTLAEVLITLGIIGIVAAMTLPVLIQKNNNRVVETRLMKFYSAINQAVKMAEVDYGDKSYWYEDVSGAQFDKDGNAIEGSSDIEKWFKKYIGPYMKVVKYETVSSGGLLVYFPDGSALKSSGLNSRNWYFYSGNIERCLKRGDDNVLGICVFAFNFYPASNTDKWKYHYKKAFEPWKYDWDGKIESLKEACYHDVRFEDATVLGTSYCTALIQANGWKIPDDYPFKVAY